MAKEPKPTPKELAKSRKSKMTFTNFNSSTGAKTSPKAGRLRRTTSAKIENKAQRMDVRAGEYGGQYKFTTTKSVRRAETNSPTKPSVAKAALKGAANKVKAQGAKINKMPTSGFQRTKPKGK